MSTNPEEDLSPQVLDSLLLAPEVVRAAIAAGSGQKSGATQEDAGGPPDRANQVE